MEIPYTVNARKDTGLYNAKVGIWLFLASEVMLFGGLFSGYIFLRVYADYPWPERALPVVPGLINTFILIGSSVTVVFAWAALKMRKWRQFQFYMGVTLLCALVFLGLKTIEYKAKLEHQGVRMKDFVVLEGHTHPANLTADGQFKSVHGYAALPPTDPNFQLVTSSEDEGHADSHDEGEHGALDKKNAEFETNQVVFVADTISVDLSKFYDPIIRDLMEQATKQGSEITLTKDYVGRDGGKKPYEVSETVLKKEGELLSVGLLKDLRGIYLTNKASNEKIRTTQKKDAWARLRAEEGNESVLGYKIKDDLAPNEKFDKFVVDLTSGVEFTVTPPATFVLVPRDVRETSDTAILNDVTTLSGELNEKSSAIEMALDAIDFTFVAQRAREKDLDPVTAIENTWIIQNNETVRDLWEKHQAEIALLATELRTDYGLDKNGNPKRVPTDTERYRIGWQNLVNMGEGAKVKGVMSGFSGPNHKKEYAKHFPEVVIPRGEVNLESKFTPRWNTYYALYFLITGLHGLHVVGGIIVLGHFLFFGKKIYLKNPEHLANRVEVGGLFWHFVDLVWIFLFPILYLM